MVNVGLHSVATYHRKFGKEKIKIYFAECPRTALGKEFFAECHTWDTRRSFFDSLCRVLGSGHSTKMSLPSVGPRTLGKDVFVECRTPRPTAPSPHRAIFANHRRSGHLPANPSLDLANLRTSPPISDCPRHFCHPPRLRYTFLIYTYGWSIRNYMWLIWLLLGYMKWLHIVICSWSTYGYIKLLGLILSDNTRHSAMIRLKYKCSLHVAM
jgi:hypothetical protein